MILALTGCESSGETKKTIPEPVFLLSHEIKTSEEIIALDPDELTACYLRIFELERVIVEAQIWYKQNFPDTSEEK